MRRLAVVMLLLLAPLACAQQSAIPVLRVLAPEARTRPGLPELDTPANLRRLRLHAEALVRDEEWRATVSSLIAQHGRDELLARARFLVETGERGAERAETWLEDERLDDATGDDLALHMETTLPLIAARGALLGACAIERIDNEAARTLASLALSYADASASRHPLLPLTRAHALRLLGRHDEALASYALVDGLIDELIDEQPLPNADELRLEAQLGVILAARGAGAPAGEAIAMLD